MSNTTHLLCMHPPPPALQLAVLSSLSHPNIVRCYGTAREGPSLLIFLEYVPVSSTLYCMAEQRQLCTDMHGDISENSSSSLELCTLTLLSHCTMRFDAS